MVDEPEAPQTPPAGPEPILWGRLAAAWGVGLLVRALVFAATFFVGLLFLGENWPRIAHWALFVPSSVACALVAVAIYPGKGLLAAAVPLLLPPDYALPLGVVVAATLSLPRMAAHRGAVAMVAGLVTVALCVLPLLPGFLSAGHTVADLGPEIESFLNRVVLAQPASITWETVGRQYGPNGLTMRGQAAQPHVRVTAVVKPVAGTTGTGNAPGSQWPRKGGCEVAQIDLFFWQSVGQSSPSELARAGILRPEFARRVTPMPRPYSSALPARRFDGGSYFVRTAEYTAVYVNVRSSPTQPMRASLTLVHRPPASLGATPGR